MPPEPTDDQTINQLITRQAQLAARADALDARKATQAKLLRGQ